MTVATRLRLHSIQQGCRSILIVYLERFLLSPGSVRADHQPRGCFAGLGGLSLLLGESRLWVFQEMSDLPGFRVTDQLELRKGGRRPGGEVSRQPSFCLAHEPETDKPQPQTRPAVEALNRKPRTSGAPLPLKAVRVWVCVCVCVCPCLCARLFSLPLLFSGMGMQTGLETTGLVVTREPDTRSPTLTVPQPSSDSDPGSDPPSQATLQHLASSHHALQEKDFFFPLGFGWF